jgi:hypothetical protein
MHIWPIVLNLRMFWNFLQILTSKKTLQFAHPFWTYCQEQVQKCQTTGALYLHKCHYKICFRNFWNKKTFLKKKNIRHFLLTRYIGKCFDTWMQYYYVCWLKMMLKIKYHIIKICTKVKTHYTPKYCSHININSTFGFFGYMWTPHLGLFLFISSILH